MMEPLLRGLLQGAGWLLWEKREDARSQGAIPRMEEEGPEALGWQWTGVRALSEAEGEVCAW